MAKYQTELASVAPRLTIRVEEHALAGHSLSQHLREASDRWLGVGRSLVGYWYIAVKSQA